MDRLAELKGRYEAANAAVQEASQKANVAYHEYEEALADAGQLFVVTRTDLYGDITMDKYLTFEDAQAEAKAYLEGDFWPIIVKARIQGPSTDLVLTDGHAN